MPDHDRAITIDANVYGYILTYMFNGTTPDNCELIAEFISVLEKGKYIIAINDYIIREYEDLVGAEINHMLIHKWSKESRIIDKQPIPIPLKVSNCMRDEYKFDIHMRDMTYLETANGTTFKLLITENTRDFCRSHRNGKRRPRLDEYIIKELGIKIAGINQGCHHMSVVLVGEITSELESAATSVGR